MIQDVLSVIPGCGIIDKSRITFDPPAVAEGLPAIAGFSPHLNIAEVLWRKLKCEWLRPEDYVMLDSAQLLGTETRGCRGDGKITKDGRMSISSAGRHEVKQGQ